MILRQSFPEEEKIKKKSEHSKSVSRETFSEPNTSSSKT